MIQAPSPAPVLVLVKASLPLPRTQHLSILTTPVSVYTAPAREGSTSSSQSVSWNSTESFGRIPLEFLHKIWLIKENLHQMKKTLKRGQ